MKEKGDGMSDLIDRQAAIDECYPVTVDGEVYEVVQVETLMELPSAQPEPKTGRWIKMSDSYGAYHCCSRCGREGACDWNYCPNCGTRMEDTDETD